MTSRLRLRHTKREPLRALLVTLAGSDRIEVDFPVLFAEPSTRKITVDPEPTIVHAKKLMIVDDDVEMRTLLAEYFRRLGFEVAEKENAALALQAVTTDRFDCFILDVAMPEMSGIELLKKLRERGIDTPTLFLTAHDLLDDLRRVWLAEVAEAAGIDAFTPGEVSFAAQREAQIDALADAVEEHLDLDRVLDLAVDGAPALPVVGGGLA